MFVLSTFDTPMIRLPKGYRDLKLSVVFTIDVCGAWLFPTIHRLHRFHPFTEKTTVYAFNDFLYQFYHLNSDCNSRHMLRNTDFLVLLQLGYTITINSIGTIKTKLFITNLVVGNLALKIQKLKKLSYCNKKSVVCW